MVYLLDLLIRWHIIYIRVVFDILKIDRLPQQFFIVNIFLLKKKLIPLFTEWCCHFVLQAVNIVVNSLILFIRVREDYFYFCFTPQALMGNLRNKKLWLGSCF